MSAEAPEVNPYELLGLRVEATERDIKSAYRKLSLSVHPDRNPNNPLAAQKFHELNQAYELLLDPLRRLALNAAVQAKEARNARFAKLDAKRKHLQEELDEAERASKKRRAGTAQHAQERAQEAERIKEAGRKLREEKEKELARRRAQDDAASADPEHVDDIAPQLGKHDTTIKLRFTLSAHPELAERAALLSLVSRFGAADERTLVLSVKPPKKAPQRPPKFGTAIVEFRQIRDAFGAVCASGRKDRGMDGIEVSWADGSEPPILAWLRKQGMLGAAEKSTEAPSSATQASPSSADLLASLNAKIAKSTQPSTFSSFPDSFPSAQETSNATGLDYESLTFMRLMNAGKERLERERLEREILEQEAKE